MDETAREAMQLLEAAGVIAPEVDGARMLDEVGALLDRFVVFPARSYRDAVALWVGHAHTLQAFESTPRLALLSPEKESGKTRVLEVLDGLVPRPMHAASLSAAALFRVAAKQPTLLLDEADTYLGPRVAEKHEDLRGLINAGHRRGAVAYRCVGEPSKMQVVEFPAFAAVALAGLGDLPDTIINRSVVVRMKPRAPGEVVESFRQRDVAEICGPVRVSLEAWAESHIHALSDARPELPAGITDRAADVWEPLIAVADAAGGHWPNTARKAAAEIVAQSAASNPSLGVQLLNDIRGVFRSRQADRLATEQLVSALCDLDESPWGNLRGKPIDARGIAFRLRPYDVRPDSVRLDGGTRKGYLAEWFHDAWARYLPSSSQEAEQPEHREQGRSKGVSAVPAPNAVPARSGTRAARGTGNKALTRDVTAVPLVPDSEGRKAHSPPNQGPPNLHEGPRATCETCPVDTFFYRDEALEHPICAKCRRAS